MSKIAPYAIAVILTFCATQYGFYLNGNRLIQVYSSLSNAYVEFPESQCKKAEVRFHTDEKTMTLPHIAFTDKKPREAPYANTLNSTVFFNPTYYQTFYHNLLVTNLENDKIRFIFSQTGMIDANAQLKITLKSGNNEIVKPIVSDFKYIQTVTLGPAEWSVIGTTIPGENIPVLIEFVARGLNSTVRMDIELSRVGHAFVAQGGILADCKPGLMECLFPRDLECPNGPLYAIVTGESRDKNAGFYLQRESPFGNILGVRLSDILLTPLVILCSSFFGLMIGGGSYVFLFGFLGSKNRDESIFFGFMVVVFSFFDISLSPSIWDVLTVALWVRSVGFFCLVAPYVVGVVLAIRDHLKSRSSRILLVSRKQELLPITYIK